jgi:hypothetical protein
LSEQAAVACNVGVVVLAALLILPLPAEAASCRGYLQPVRAAIKSRVEALRMIEREAADRLAGLDTRPFPFLAGEARKGADAIAGPFTRREKEGTRHCGKFVPPVRRICRSAAELLVSLLKAQEAGAATKDAGRAYADAMTYCERFMDLPPLKTAIRTSD